TTDVPVDRIQPDPKPSEMEIEFILEAARGYLEVAPSRADVLAGFAGLRPLVGAGLQGETRTLSREHSILIEHGNLISIAGGKWTTYRRMAVDALGQASKRGLIPDSTSSTAGLQLDVDVELERAREAAEGSRGLNGSAVEHYARQAMQFEQARAADDILDRRLRIGVTDDRAADAIRAAVARMKIGP
ncbi:MAG: hypothetical protein ACREBN_12280, partial [Burkholderiaceae bacterium]